MHSKASLGLGVVIMGLSAWAVFTATQWPLKAALFPLVIGVPVFCLAAAEVLWILFGSSPSPEGTEHQPSEDLPETIPLRNTLAAIAWILGLFVVIVLLGFPVAVPLFVLIYVKWQGREGWVLSLAYTLAVWGLFCGLFAQVLHLPFPAGWIQAWIGLV